MYDEYKDFDQQQSKKNSDITDFGNFAAALENNMKEISNSNDDLQILITSYRNIMNIFQSVDPLETGRFIDESMIPLFIQHLKITDPPISACASDLIRAYIKESSKNFDIFKETEIINQIIEILTLCNDIYTLSNIISVIIQLYDDKTSEDFILNTINQDSIFVIIDHCFSALQSVERSEISDRLILRILVLLYTILSNRVYYHFQFHHRVLEFMDSHYEIWNVISNADIIYFIYLIYFNLIHKFSFNINAQIFDLFMRWKNEGHWCAVHFIALLIEKNQFRGIPPPDVLLAHLLAIDRPEVISYLFDVQYFIIAKNLNHLQYLFAGDPSYAAQLIQHAQNNTYTYLLHLSLFIAKIIILSNNINNIEYFGSLYDLGILNLFCDVISPENDETVIILKAIYILLEKPAISDKALEYAKSEDFMDQLEECMDSQNKEISEIATIINDFIEKQTEE